MGVTVDLSATVEHPLEEGVRRLQLPPRLVRERDVAHRPQRVRMLLPEYPSARGEHLTQHWLGPFELSDLEERLP